MNIAGRRRTRAVRRESGRCRTRRGRAAATDRQTHRTKPRRRWRSPRYCSYRGTVHCSEQWRSPRYCSYRGTVHCSEQWRSYTAPTKVRYIVVNNEGVYCSYKGTLHCSEQWRSERYCSYKGTLHCSEQWRSERYCSYKGTVQSLDTMKEPVILLLHSRYCMCLFQLREDVEDTTSLAVQ